MEHVCLFVCSEVYILSRKANFYVFTKWHYIFLQYLYLTMNDNVSKSEEGVCQACSCAFQT